MMALQIEITGRNMEVTDRLNEYVPKKRPNWIVI